MTLRGRLDRLEARHPPPSADPWLVQVHVCHDGTSAILCYTRRPSEVITLSEYRRRYAPGALFERWTILGDATAIDDRICEHWPVRRQTEAG